MSATNMRQKYPNLTDLLIVLCMLGLMIASKRCAAQTIQTDTIVLKYLYKEAASAYYMRKDIILLDSTISLQKDIIASKDSIIINEAEKLKICELEKSVKDSQIANCEKELKKANRATLFYKITTGLALIATGWFIVN